MSDDKVKLGDSPDWDGAANDVLERIKMLRAVWEYDRSPDSMIRRDLILPAMRKLAEFCAMVRVDERDTLTLRAGTEEPEEAS